MGAEGGVPRGLAPLAHRAQGATPWVLDIYLNICIQIVCELQLFDLSLFLIVIYLLLALPPQGFI